MTRTVTKIALALTLATSALTITAMPSKAQEAVVVAPDVEALFKSSDPKLNTNKQATYGIIRDLLEAGHWDKADQYLTQRYLQHNPNAASGRDGVVEYFTKILKIEPKPIAEKLTSPVAFVTAEGDLVTVGFVREMKDPKDPSKSYTTTWFDTWRFVDGKADEHWDSAIRGDQ